MSDVDQERAAFEAWLHTKWVTPHGIQKDEAGVYKHGEARRFWECWQAGRAAMAAAPVQASDREIAAAPAAPQVPICQACKGSGEGGIYQVPGTKSDFVDGPCHSCGGSGEAAPQVPAVPGSKAMQYLRQEVEADMQTVRNAFGLPAAPGAPQPAARVPRWLSNAEIQIIAQAFGISMKDEGDLVVALVHSSLRAAGVKEQT